jgi:hypothetical protein
LDRKAQGLEKFVQVLTHGFAHAFFSQPFAPSQVDCGSLAASHLFDLPATLQQQTFALLSWSFISLLNF